MATVKLKSSLPINDEATLQQLCDAATNSLRMLECSWHARGHALGACDDATQLHDYFGRMAILMHSRSTYFRPVLTI